MKEAHVRYIFVYPDPYILQYDITHGICLCLVALAFIWHMNYMVDIFTAIQIQIQIHIIYST